MSNYLDPKPDSFAWRQGKQAYWDFECGNTDVQSDNPYSPFTQNHKDWDDGYGYAMNVEDNL